MARLFIAKALTHKENIMLGVGNKVPLTKFVGREGDVAPEGGCPIGGKFVELTAHDVFKDKRVVVFALPGAWTPTCSSQQLPGYEAMYDDFKAKGIDEVYCLSVNDGFVMNSWFEKDGIEKVKPLCDGNLSFTLGMEMDVAKYNLGFGIRSWRYAMVVTNGTIEWMGVEPGIADNAETDPYGESAPEKVMEYLNK
jgi:peroxiredoxin